MTRLRRSTLDDGIVSSILEKKSADGQDFEMNVKRAKLDNDV